MGARKISSSSDEGEGDEGVWEVPPGTIKGPAPPTANSGAAAARGVLRLGALIGRGGRGPEAVLADGGVVHVDGGRGRGQIIGGPPDIPFDPVRGEGGDVLEVDEHHVVLPDGHPARRVRRLTNPDLEVNPLVHGN